jgi:WD40 repeat protein
MAHKADQTRTPRKIPNCFGDVRFHFFTPFKPTFHWFNLLRETLSKPSARVPRFIAVGTRRNLAYLYDIREKRRLMLMSTEVPVSSLLVLNDDYLVTTGKNYSLRVYRIPTGSLITILYGHQRQIYSMARIRQNIMVTGSMDNSVRVWDVLKNACLHVLHGHTGAVCCLQRIDDTRVASGGEDKLILIWDVEKGTCLKMFQEHREMVYCMTMIGDHKLVSGGFDNIRVWDVNRYTCINQFSAGDHYDMCRMEGDEIAVTYSGTFISVWNITTSTNSTPFHINALKLGYAGKSKVVVGGKDGISIVSINGNQISTEKIEFDDRVACMSVY